MSAFMNNLKSMPRRRVVFMVVGVFTGAALGVTSVRMATRPTAPGLPTSAQEAITVMASDRYDLLDAERKRQYLDETRRLMRALSEEERRALIEDGALRDAMRETRQDMMDERAREFARTGEMPEFSRRGEGGGDGFRQRMREQFESMTDEEREIMLSTPGNHFEG